MTFQERVGERLRKLRKSTNTTSKELAEAICYSINQIFHIERGASRANIEYIALICEFYDISIDSLVFDTDEQFEELLNELRGVKNEIRRVS